MAAMQTKPNLIHLVKYENTTNGIYPSEEITLCSEEFEKAKDKFSDYGIIGRVSSIPGIWCERTYNPKDFYNNPVN
jgi:hypothetical protein